MNSYYWDATDIETGERVGGGLASHRVKRRP